MKFESAYEEFLKFHIKRRIGQDADRIKGGLSHAEKLFLGNVWWPAFHNFDGLHPEYKIRDFKDGNRYIDYAYVQPHFKIAIEIDGIGTHWKDITQAQFSDHCQRQNHLVIDQWHVLRFAYTDVDNSPRLCQQTIQQLLGRLLSDSSTSMQKLKVLDREIVRLALTQSRPLCASDLITRMQLSHNTASLHLKKLADMGWLVPASGSRRIRYYRIHPSQSNIML